MDTSGTNFHRSNLLGTLAYFGSPAVALRTQANASALDSTALYSRAVMPLSSSAIGGVDVNTTVQAANVTPVEVSNTTAPETTVATQHGTVTTETTTTTTGPGHTTVHNTGPNTHNVISHNISVSGDPHFEYNGTEWTQQGIPGDTYLIASGNGVFVSALYGQNGGYSYCTMQEAQVVIAANPAAGIPSDIVLNYGIYDQSQLQITQNGQTIDVQNDGFNQTFGTGAGAVQVQGNGDALTITTTSLTGQQGTFNIDSSWGLGLEITAQGTFDNANGLMQYIEQNNNINLDQGTLDSYAEGNFNLTALGGADNNAYVIDPTHMAGFSNWQQGNPGWNQAFSNN